MCLTNDRFIYCNHTGIVITSAFQDFLSKRKRSCIFFSFAECLGKHCIFDLPLVCDQYRRKTFLPSKYDSSRTQILLTIGRFLDGNFICDNVKSTSPHCARILVSSFEKPKARKFSTFYRCFRRAERNSRERNCAISAA